MISRSKITGGALFFFAPSFSFHSCAESLVTPSESEVAMNVQSEIKNKVIVDVYNYLKAKKMTILDDRCLSYDFEDRASSYYSVTVRETNRHDICGSDSNISAVLFNFYIDKKSWEMSTDAYSADGSFSLVR